MTGYESREKAGERGGVRPTRSGSSGKLGTVIGVVLGAVFVGWAAVGCGVGIEELPRLNAFAERVGIAFGEDEQSVSDKVIPIGFRQRGEVIRLRVVGRGVRDVFILAKDGLSDQAGRIAGGGRPAEFFQHRIAEDNEYFVYLLFEASVPRVARRADVIFLPGDPNYRPPAVQRVVLSFEPNFVIVPTLEADEIEVLRSIGELVRQGIVGRLREVFAGTPIEVYDEAEGLPEAPFSRVTFKPNFVLVEAGSSNIPTDSVVPVVVSDASDCDVPVVFGEVLPRGAATDTGNGTLDDEAAVYVGSFAGRSRACRTATFNSVNHLVVGLSRTAAHEIGHLVGLQHVPGFDIMQRSPDLSAQRDLSFGRGLIVVDGDVPDDERDEGVLSGPPPVPGVVFFRSYFGLSNVIQDPELYFRANFDVP